MAHFLDPKGGAGTPSVGRQPSPERGDRKSSVPGTGQLQGEASIGAHMSLFVLSLIVIAIACSRGEQPFNPLRALHPGTKAPPVAPVEDSPPVSEPVEQPTPVTTPTPDPVRQPPSQEALPEWYVVQPGDSLNRIAGAFGVGVQQILTDNGLGNPDFLSVGQVLHLPTPFPQNPSPSLKIVPDSELVYGPGSMDFDVEQEVARWQGALHDYRGTGG